jgi:hypothetical protein
MIDVLIHEEESDNGITTSKMNQAQTLKAPVNCERNSMYAYFRPMAPLIRGEGFTSPSLGILDIDTR